MKHQNSILPAERPLIESLEQRSLCSATVLSTPLAAAAPAAAAKSVPAPAVDVTAAAVVLRPHAPVALADGFVETDGAVFSSGRVRVFDGQVPPAGNVAASASASASAFISQVFSLLTQISGGPGAAPATISETPQLATASVANAPATNSQVSAMAVEASTLAKATDSIETIASVPAVHQIQVQSATTGALTQTAPSPLPVAPAEILHVTPAAPEQSHATVKAILSEATAIIHTATGIFVPNTQIIAVSAHYAEAAANVAPAVYNFLRFDPATFIGGAVADFTREMTNFAPTHTMGLAGDHRWAWLITGAVVTADVVMVAQYQIRRARAIREKRSAQPSPFCRTFISEFIRD
jgi:hypothetical protein